MRKKKNLIPRMERCSACLISEPYSMPGKWKSLMPDARELRVELGCGKGRFTAGTAAQERDVLFIAVEKVPDAMVIAMERVHAEGLSNVFFISADADQLPLFFAPGEIDRIYINFCDPWPTRRQAKRRLTHGNFLQLYRKVLSPGAQIHFKTDNVPLFEFSMEEFPSYGFALSEITRDLHKDGPVGVMTDYEAKFFELGQPINRCVATPVPWGASEPIDVESFRQKWLALYGSGVNQQQLDASVLGNGNFLWHLFSFHLLPALEGDAARQALDLVEDPTALFLYEGKWNDTPYVHPTVRVNAAALEGRRDLYLIGSDLSWTYVHTHEAACGPYFCRLK